MLFKVKSIFPKTLVVDTFDSDVWQNLKTYDHPERINNVVSILPLNKLVSWKTGIARIFDSDTDKMMAEIQNHSKNTFIVFEDATKYIGSKLTTDVRKFVLDSKQKNLDLVFVFHSLMAIPPELIRISDILILFKTNDAKLPAKYDSWPNIEQIRLKLKASDNRYINKAIELN
ncbi:MAG: hypothetical protein M9916_00900 [Crocinitomicaceae bacterium]|nr:hypothetical protein [Crocinitomicaceae bacterium]